MRAWPDLWEKWQNRRSRVEVPVADASAVPVAQKRLGCSHTHRAAGTLKGGPQDDSCQGEFE